MDNVSHKHKGLDKLQIVDVDGFTPVPKPEKEAAKCKTATQYLTHPWNLPPPGSLNLSGLAINTSLKYSEEM